MGNLPWDDTDNEILSEFARGKWSVESQRGPVWGLWTHSTRTARAARLHWAASVSKTPQGAAAAAAGKAAAKARLEARDAEMEELVSQGLSWDEIEAKIPLEVLRVILPYERIQLTVGCRLRGAGL